MGEIARGSEPGDSTRLLASVFEPFHSIVYYTPEIMRMTEFGYRGWWHAYFAYRFAPMGPVPASVVTATAYNFAPRFIERSVPGVWSIQPPAEALASHGSLVDAALGRIFGDGVFSETIEEAAALARRSVEGMDVGARALFGAHADLAWPTNPAKALLHACTLLREYRGDSHNISLANADLDGVECHLLMAARGHGNQATIEGIRGWTLEEWDAAAERLIERGFLNTDKTETAAGHQARSDLERETDRLSSAPATRLGAADAARLTDLLEPLVAHLTSNGEIAGQWPPPAVMK
ncbi:MAG: hypothetical protein ACI8TP_004237 [Acidimicrobiales bacterium]|jgi:hypothetical protein